VREVFGRLEALAVPYFLTGSDALARYGQPRQTMDIDLVVGIAPADFAALARSFEDDFLVNEPIDLGIRSMASIISISELGKVDLILGRDDAWGRSAMSRRERWDHPEYGPLWVSTLEDLILAKVEWSGGSSELQLRDVRNLIVANRDRVDWAYVERWAAIIDVVVPLQAVRDAS
jgi:hypothetical protein